MLIHHIPSGLREFFSTMLVGIPGRLTELSDVSAHGAYIGFNPIAASRGLSLGESWIEFSINHDGIKMLQRVSADSGTYDFYVVYPPEWIFHLKGWGMDNCLSLRQGKDSKLASFIFAFAPRISFATCDVVMMLGEGMPAIVGAFIRKEKGLERLKKIYQKVYIEPDADINNPQSWLLPIDIVSAKNFMRSDNSEVKVQLIKDAGHNLWTGSEEEIAERIALVEIGLRDKNPIVQCAALSTFELGGRITGGVQLVIDMLTRFQFLRVDVLEKALSAAACLLYEAYRFNSDRAKLHNTFGTSDIVAIYMKSDGFITPDDAEIIQRVAHHVTPQHAWTYEHCVDLRNAISKVIATTGHIHKRVREEGERVLKDYPLSVQRVPKISLTEDVSV